MTRTRLTAPGLLLRHLRSGGAVSLLLPVLVLLAVLSIALAPRALGQVATDEVQQDLAQQSPLIVDLVATGRLGIPLSESRLGTEYLTDTTESALEAFRERIPSPLLDATGPISWMVQTPVDTAEVADLEARATLSLSIDLEWLDQVDIVEGVAPTGWAPIGGVGLSAGEPPPIEVAISTASATALGVEVGDVIGFTPAPLVVTAVYEPREPTDRRWMHAADLAAPQVLRGERAETIIRTSVYVSPESFASLTEELAVGTMCAWMPIDPASMSYADAVELEEQARQVLTASPGLQYGGELDFRSNLPDLIAATMVRVAAMSALIALSVSGLAGVLVAVFALGVRSVLTRRATALSLAAARGAGELQLRGVMALEMLVLSMPAAVLGVAIAATLIPDESGPLETLLPAAVGLIPALLAGALTTARPSARRRHDLTSPARSRARIIIELSVVALAALALLLLSRRGLAGPSTVVGIDPLLSATPLLLAIAACLGALRLYPWVLRAVQQRVRRRGDATAVFGSARALRDPALGFATALALVVGVSIVVFSTVLSSTVSAGLIDRAAVEVGADARLQAAVIDDSMIAAVRELEGVTAAVAYSVTPDVPFVVDGDDRTASVIVADAAALQAVRPDLPDASFAAGAVPVVLSSNWSAVSVGATGTLGEADIVVADVIDAGVLPGAGRGWILVDADAAAALGVELAVPTVALLSVADDADPASLTAEARQIIEQAQPTGAAVVTSTDRATALATARTPIVEGLEAALVIAALASLALMLITIVLATAAAAAARNRLLGILRVIGMSTAQLRRVQSWELGPLAVVALAVGTLLGLVLPTLVTAVLDLRDFIGGEAVVGAVIEPLPVLLVLALFAGIVAVAAVIALALGRRLAPAGILTMGDSS